MRKLLLSVAFTGMLASIAEAQQVPYPRIAEIVSAGKVRVGLFLPQYTKDPISGELQGVGAHVVSIEVARALAARLGVATQLVGYTTPPEVVECLKAGQCDLGIMGVDPTRAAELGLSPAFIQFDFTHLVPADSSIRSVADAHLPGVRIAVVRNHASTLALTRILKHTEFVDAATPESAFDLLRAGRADTLASSRPTLLDYSAELPGSRVLEDRYGVNLVAIAVPKSQAGQLTYVSEFIEEAKASGLVQRVIERAGLRGFQVAPPRKHGDSQ
jgi:polar amino acid transport system substrate-binding protein